MAVNVATLGYPRIGLKRETKFALEKYWNSQSSLDELLEHARSVRLRSLRDQRDRGATILPSNDFSLYDHILDAAAMVGALAKRHIIDGDLSSIDSYFAAARGVQGASSDDPGI